MTKGEKFIKRGKWKKNPCSPMSNAASCGLNCYGDTFKLHNLCENPDCKCRKQITYTPKQFQIEEAGFENTTKKKHSKQVKKHWIRFFDF